ncbi:MAG: DNA polymerase III subunit delta [Bacteroidaceae bacterium]|nr:DNA polymerase III subunit delta [Bacteroidaceae bacterium]
MATKENGITFEEIEKRVRAGVFAPVYCLMGDEDYYIDRIEKLVTEAVVKPEERDFNYDLLYGGESRASDVVNIARQFPMMADRRLVVVREFQAMSDRDSLAAYCKNPCPTTVLVLCYKHGTLDRRRALAAEIKKSGVLFESKRLYENHLPAFVNSYMKAQGAAIEPKAVQMLCDHVGCDLSRLASEMDKLLVASAGDRRVGAELVEQQTGVSKDYNTIELQNALAHHDAEKAMRIVKYFNTNPKSFALPPVLSSLFGFFSDVLLAYYAPSQSDEGIADYLGKNAWVAKQALIPARRSYQGTKVVNILARIRETDAKSKGVGGCKTSPGELLQELIFFILH